MLILNAVGLQIRPSGVQVEEVTCLTSQTVTL